MATSTHGSRSTTLKFNETTTDPTVTDDTTEGYAVHSIWINTTDDTAFICTDATDGAAVWEEITGAASGGGGGTNAVTTTNFMVPTVLLDSTLAATATTFTISDIANGGYDYIEIDLFLRTDRADFDDYCYMNFNGDTTNSNYRVGALGGDVGDDRRINRVNGASAPSNSFANSRVIIPTPSSTKHKQAFIWHGDRIGASDKGASFWARTWENTAAIDTITLTPRTGPNWVVGSRVVAKGYKVRALVTDITAEGVTPTTSDIVVGTVLLDQTLTGTQASFSVSDIAAGDYDYLMVQLLARSDRAATSDAVLFSINADTTNGNYRRSSLITGAGSSNGDSDDREYARIPGSTAPSDTNGFVHAIIHNPSSAKHKTVNSHYHERIDTGIGNLAHTGLQWESTSAIDSFILTSVAGSNFVAGSRCLVVGFKAQTIVASATGDISTSTISLELPTVLLDTTLSGNQASFSVSSLSAAAYNQIEIDIFGRTDRSATDDSINISFNSDTTASNYRSETHNGGSGALSSAEGDNRICGWLTAASSPSDSFGHSRIIITNPGSAKLKELISRSHARRNTSDGLVYDTALEWESTSAIDTIDLTPTNGSNFVSGTVIQIRGYKAQSVVHTAISTESTEVVVATGDTAINNASDVTIVSQDMFADATDQLVVEGFLTILNNSGSARDYVLTLDFDSLFDIEITLPALAASSTLMHPIWVRAVLDVRSTSLCYAVVNVQGQLAAGIASGGDSTIGASSLNGMGWATSASDATGTSTVTLKIRSASATATQTCRLHHFSIARKQVGAR